MKHRRILAWLLAAVMAFGVMSAGVLAAETDAESGATAPSEAGDALKEQSRKESTEAGDGKTSKPSHGRKKKEQVAEPDGAIGKDRAKEIALADAGFTAEQTGKVRARVTEQDGTVSFLYNGEMNQLVRTLAAADIRELTVADPDLEEIVLHFYEKGGDQA